MEPEISRDTPETRIAYHMACLEARKNGHPLPRAPWEPVEAPPREEPKPRMQREGRPDSFPQLKLPSRPTGEETRAKDVDARPPRRAEPLAVKKRIIPSPGRPSARVSSPSKAKDVVPTAKDVVPTAKDVVPAAKEVEPTAKNVVLSKPPQPKAPEAPLRKDLSAQRASTLRPGSPSLVAVLRAEKERAVDRLFLCAGIPAGAATGWAFVVSVTPHLHDLISKRGLAGYSALLSKYEVGRPFLFNGSVADMVSVAEYVIRVLEAASAEQLEAREKEAGAYLLRHAKDRNEAFLRERSRLVGRPRGA